MNQRNIYKYVLVPGRNEIRLPSESVVLSAQAQSGFVSLWAIVDEGPNLRYETRVFHVVETGSILPQGNLHFIETVQMERPYGAYVVHVFELK